MLAAVVISFVELAVALALLFSHCPVFIGRSCNPSTVVMWWWVRRVLLGRSKSLLHRV